MKILSFYLPQFHETPYNNEWWGQGYTDWVASKNAKPLFRGHMQPRVPENKNYYDLSDESADTIRWQSKLAKEHGVDGFCIYHYWFPDRQLLDTPAKVLLNHKDIDIEYVFCWDSGSWKRTWTAQSNEQEILVEQDFGDESVWTKHFRDLLPYFEDDRYIKVGNKPVFQIYRAATIPCIKDMKKCWDRLAKESGFNGIYLISGDLEDRVGYDGTIDAYYNYEPNRVINKNSKGYFVKKCVAFAGIKKRLNKYFGLKLFPDKRSAKEVYKLIAKDKNLDGAVKTFYGIFSDYDDTPRRGVKGVVYTHNRVEYFEKCLEYQIRKTIDENNYFLYITAWNEWGESAYLEPDESIGMSYLDIIKRVRNKVEC